MDITDVRKKLGLLAGGMRRASVLAVAEWLRFIIRTSFERQQSPEGVPWQPLSPKYEARKGRRSGRRMARRVGPGGRPGPPVFLNTKNILYLSGELFRSTDRGMTVEENEGRVTVMSSLPYSAIHQYGGRAGRGLSALIPARPYLPGTEFAEAEAAKVIDEALQQAVDQAGMA